MSLLSVALVSKGAQASRTRNSNRLGVDWISFRFRFHQEQHCEEGRQRDNGGSIGRHLKIWGSTKFGRSRTFRD